MSDRYYLVCPNCESLSNYGIDVGEVITCDNCSKRYLLDLTWIEQDDKNKKKPLDPDKIGA